MIQRQILFSYVCNGKKIKDLCTPTLKWNSCWSSVRCVSSMLVALNIGRLVAIHADKKTIRNEQTRRQWRSFLSGAQTWNYCRGLDYARDNKSLYISMHANRKIHLFAKKAPIYMLSRSKASKCSKMQKNQYFSYGAAWTSTLAS